MILDKSQENIKIILLVEDNLAHAELVIRSFQDYHQNTQIYHVSDGESALDYLFRRGSYIDPDRSPRPHVVLLDLRLPRLDGVEVLHEVKTSDALRAIPVVILPTSNAERDIARAYAEHANSYLLKPVSFDQFAQLMTDIGVYWLARNYSLPH